MSWPTLRRTRRAALLACSLLGMALASPSSAGAHAFLIRTFPAAGQRLSAVPGELRLYFSEPIVGGSERLTVRILNRAPLALPPSVNRGAVVLQRLPSSARGVYLVDWRVLSDDGHITQGEYAFAVGSAGRLPAASSSASQPTSLGQVAAGWILLGGLAVAFGGLASELLVWRRLLWDRAGAWRAPVGVGLSLAALGGVAQLVLLASERAGRDDLYGLRPGALAGVASSRPGALSVAGLAAIGAAAAMLRRWRGLALAPLGGVVITVALRGHPGTSGAAWAAVADAMHLAAVLLWVGALVHLVAMVARSRSPGFPSVLGSGVRAYSRLALPVVLVILASGVIVALAEFHGVGELVDTAYGRTLLIKASLVALALALALGSRLRALGGNPQLRLALLRRLTGGELAALTMALAAALVLVNTAPPAPGTAGASGLLGPPPLAGEAVQLGGLAGNFEVGVAATASELRFAIVTPAQGLADGVRLTTTARPPGGPPVDLFPRACGAGCFTIRYSLRAGVTRLSVAVSGHGSLHGGTASFDLPAPVPPARPALLRRVLGVMAGVRSLELTEYVTSGPGSRVNPLRATLSGAALLADEAYSPAATDVRVLAQNPAGTFLAFALPGSHVYYRLTVDRAERIRSATIVSPGHLIQDTIAYGGQARRGRIAAPGPVLATPLQPPSPAQLALAEQAGPWITAAWVTPSGGGIAGTVRLLDYNLRPVGASIAVLGAVTSGCGSGCATFRAPRAVWPLHVLAQLGRQRQEASIPVRWQPDATARARSILGSVVRAAERLRSFRIDERLSGGQGPPNLTAYRIAGSQRYEFTTHVALPTPLVSHYVEIGRDSWFQSGVRSQGVEHNVGSPASALTLMPWWAHRSAPVRLLDISTVGGQRVAELALADLGGSTPFWFRLRVDLRSRRVTRMRMIAPGHFMLQRYYAFGRPQRILPP